MKMIHGQTKTVVNVTEWASALGLFEWFFTDDECEDGFRVAVVYGPHGDVEVGEVDMKEIKRFPGYFTPSPVTKTMSPPPGWKWTK
jgi:hypothetical protein